MRFVVTGGAGFIGSHIVEELLRGGKEVVVVDDLSSGSLRNLPIDAARCEILPHGVEEVDRDSLGTVDGIFHLAAQASVPLSIQSTYESSKNNLLSSLAALEIAKVSRAPVVFASSSAVYGELPLGDDSDSKFDLTSPYAVDKLAVEHYAQVAHALHNIRSVGLRFFNVYGPRQDPANPYSGVISVFLSRAKHGEKIFVNGGPQTRDFVFVRDVARLAIKAMDVALRGPVCERVNVCTGRAVSINALLRDICDLVGGTPDVEYRPLPAGDPTASLGTVDLMTSLLGADLADLTQLPEGLRETVKYIENAGRE